METTQKDKPAQDKPAFYDAYPAIREIKYNEKLLRRILEKDEDGDKEKCVKAISSAFDELIKYNSGVEYLNSILFSSIFRSKTIEKLYPELNTKVNGLELLRINQFNQDDVFSRNPTTIINNNYIVLYKNTDSNNAIANEILKYMKESIQRLLRNEP